MGESLDVTFQNVLMTHRIVMSKLIVMYLERQRNFVIKNKKPECQTPAILLIVMCVERELYFSNSIFYIWTFGDICPLYACDNFKSSLSINFDILYNVLYLNHIKSRNVCTRYYNLYVLI